MSLGRSTASAKSFLPEISPRCGREHVAIRHSRSRLVILPPQLLDERSTVRAGLEVLAECR